jgi:hypothetical protein
VLPAATASESPPPEESATFASRPAAHIAAEIAERVRALNVATRPTEGCPGLSRVADVHDVLDSLRLASVRLQQTFVQSGSFLAHAADRGDLAVGSGRYEGDPAAAVARARAALREAERVGGELALLLDHAAQALAGVTHRDTGPESISA